MPPNNSENRKHKRTQNSSNSSIGTKLSARSKRVNSVQKSLSALHNTRVKEPNNLGHKKRLVNTKKSSSAHTSRFNVPHMTAQIPESDPQISSSDSEFSSDESENPGPSRRLSKRRMDPDQRARGSLKSKNSSGQTPLLRIPTYTTDSETDGDELSDGDEISNGVPNLGQNQPTDTSTNDSVEYATNLHLYSLTGGHSELQTVQFILNPFHPPYMHKYLKR